ncbi:ferric transporter ATP-binding subunit [Gallibacterium salpingitidis]|uniref:Ferric transporter ATP-binding subunit n=1 Tax=Gallibacterium salpingitidis TaxID=505341 RepID=A0A1A7QEL9_9PAST|nr:ferric ABC transporter ATP-binding protein [Gallibacterium salpingitidis]OBW91253.1 ferric transporter ATP-binding subunit [Gallibacterium salpingitidis]OBX07025.1 ferric transporter ATP-binding subunit [Gallibacterium salpingitidis]OBX11890.1 ferric transporter ATP-binding subunit [Gallibacterium salpingitidis]WKT00303.1 ferric ABC transporter ATP-binding protein [Gallibacterium salpingitidis]
MNNDNNFLVLKNVTKRFGKSVVIDDLSLTIKRGTMTTLLGPSGCGKTTILRLVSGLERPTEGQIFIDGEDVTKSSIQSRDICIVFQSYALFPHMSIADNVGYGLKMLGVSPEERKQRVEEALELVDLAGFGERYVDQISGGQQQRVALARALVLKPKVLLFDEPLSNLDANLRRSMREKIRELQQKFNITSLYVTHDQSEAFAVSDEVIVMNKGKIMQKAPAKVLYQRPNSLFLAKFMGEASILNGVLHNNQVTVNGYTLPLAADEFAVADGECLVGIRPEAITLNKEGDPATRCVIKSAVYMGNHWEIIIIWGNDELLVNLAPEHFNENTQEAYLQIATTGIFLLNKQQ